MNNKMIEALNENKIIVIARGVAKKKLIPVAEALYDGGIRFLEVTYSPDGSSSDEETAEKIKSLCEHFEGRMYIGAGTVLNVKQVELTEAAGGKFIISPDVCEEVIRKTKELGMVSMPGALTPTEIQMAHKAGADYIKLFPSANMGIDYIKAIKAPLSHIKLLAVGGVNEDNLSDFFAAGICGVGVGSNIVKKSFIENSEFEKITELARKYTNQI